MDILVATILTLNVISSTVIDDTDLKIISGKMGVKKETLECQPLSSFQTCRGDSLKSNSCKTIVITANVILTNKPHGRNKTFSSREYELSQVDTLEINNCGD